ncbi:MAG TPA: GNAT family protein [Pseudonocardia sp.]|nr:GNAT family protein [Pseudonocardia sp.]
MTSTTQRVMPSELRVRPVTGDDHEELRAVLSADRIREMADSGIDETYEAAADGSIALIVQGVARAWFVELPGHGTLSVQTYTPFGIPGVWGGDVINGALAGTVGRKGVGTAAMAAVMDELFAAPDVHRLMGFVAVTNVPSLRMCDRLGFTREGTARQMLPHGEGHVDAVVMGLLRGEWRGSAAIEKEMSA